MARVQNFKMDSEEDEGILLFSSSTKPLVNLEANQQAIFISREYVNTTVALTAEDIKKCVVTFEQIMADSKRLVNCQVS